MENYKISSPHKKKERAPKKLSLFFINAEVISIEASSNTKNLDLLIRSGLNANWMLTGFWPKI
ncbi:hypothetical protein CW370_05860 [Bacillus sp. SN32]|nr:hypothetical protein CW370_05860 [Bacillus sp. SN32]